MLADKIGNFSSAGGNRQCVVESWRGDERVTGTLDIEAFARSGKIGGELLIELIKRFFGARKVAAFPVKRDQFCAVGGKNIVDGERRGRGLRHRARILRGRARVGGVIG